MRWASLHAGSRGGDCAVKRALDRETLATPSHSVCPALRQRICQHYRQRYGVTVAPERVVVTTGSSPASCWRSSRCSTRRQGRAAFARLSLLPAHADRTRPGAGSDADGCGLAWMPTAAQIEDAKGRENIAVSSSPARQSTGPAGAGPAGRDCRRVPRQQRLVRVRRDLPRLTYGTQEETALAHNATPSSSTASRSTSR